MICHLKPAALLLSLPLLLGALTANAANPAPSSAPVVGSSADAAYREARASSDLAPISLRGQLQSEGSSRFMIGTSERIVLTRVPDAPLSAAHATPSDAPADTSSRSDPTPILAADVPASYRSLLHGDGSFAFHDLAPGTYVLDLLSKTHQYHRYRVDVPRRTASTQRGANDPAVRVYLPGHDLASSLSAVPLSLPLAITPLSKHDFFTETEAFNIQGMFANPMMLIGAGSMLMIFIMPKLMATMDPEAVAEMEASQASMQKKVAALQSGDLGSFFNPGGSSGGGAQEARAGVAGSPSGAGGRSNGVTKRR